MEDLAPPLELLIEIQAALARGASVRAGILSFMESHRGEFALQVGVWLYQIEHQTVGLPILNKIKSPHRRALLEVLRQGLRGQSIAPLLEGYKNELIEASERELTKEVSRLPLRSLAPLLLLQFPAYLILILGPWLRRLAEGFH